MTKIFCWKLDYDKCVYVDSDAMVLRNCEELFDYPELSAVPGEYNKSIHWNI